MFWSNDYNGWNIDYKFKNLFSLVLQGLVHGHVTGYLLNKLWQHINMTQWSECVIWVDTQTERQGGIEEQQANRGWQQSRQKGEDEDKGMEWKFQSSPPL